MTVKDLKAKYPHSRTSVAINAAIRAELPGGAAVLDALEYPAASQHSLEELKALRDQKAAMIAEIRRRYGMPETEET